MRIAPHSSVRHRTEMHRATADPSPLRCPVCEQPILQGEQTSTSEDAPDEVDLFQNHLESCLRTSSRLEDAEDDDEGTYFSYQRSMTVAKRGVGGCVNSLLRPVNWSLE